MQSINFEIGNYKEYAINGDERNTIKIDVSDIGIIDRLQTAMAEISDYQQKLDSITEPSDSVVSEMDSTAREIINKAFDSDVCTKAFGSKNCFSVASNGQPVIINFLNAFMPIIKNDFSLAIENQQSELKGKTSKYIDPVVNGPATEIDVSTLSEGQKKALIEELKK